MRKIPMVLAVLVVAAVVMATSAFTLHPLAVRNGVVTDYSAGSSMTIRGEHYTQTYTLRSMAGNNASSGGATIQGLGVGAHVTVFAVCSGGGKGASGATSSAAPAKGNGNNHNNRADLSSTANTNTCAALFVIVHQAAPNSTTSGTMPAASATPSGTGTAMPSGSATPMVTATPTP